MFDGLPDSVWLQIGNLVDTISRVKLVCTNKRIRNLLLESQDSWKKSVADFIPGKFITEYIQNGELRRKSSFTILQQLSNTMNEAFVGDWRSRLTERDVEHVTIYDYQRVFNQVSGFIMVYDRSYCMVYGFDGSIVRSFLFWMSRQFVWEDVDDYFQQFVQRQALDDGIFGESQEEWD
eukprot:TRINITY_DN9021_c0_g2_i2.p1 TRINITY_DN9021_c0_g2~~TRINITY_DN9021_c0_g2_i2.p1  ORF type:complete len:195 (-),score=16.40 TRINITY_DN9021_c0_g2_i2:21-554(-)